jgi:hypothetical protein
MRCGAVCLSEFVSADQSEQSNQHSCKNRVIVDGQNHADVTPYTQRVQRGVQAILKLDSKRPLQFSEQSAPVVAQLFVGMVKRLAHALPIDMAEISQFLPVLSDSLLNQISAFLDNGGQMPSPSLLVYNDDRDGCVIGITDGFPIAGRWTWGAFLRLVYG